MTETVLKTVRAETTAVPQTEAVLETIPETIPEVPDAGETEDAVNTTAPAEVTASSRSDYAEAYLELCQELNEEDSSLMYDLIDADGTGAPELVVSRVGYAVSLYTYENGKVYTLMDNWGYGVMGNYGYEYIPGQNVFYNHNADYAGLISYDTYMEISADNTLAVIKTVEYQYFDDRNDNDEPDEDEQDSYSNTPYRCFDVTSQNSRFEITAESAELYAQDDFTFLTAEMTYEQITELLNES